MDTLTSAEHTSFVIINKIFHKINRFETYANLRMFFSIFKAKKAESLYSRFHNLKNRNMIDFYSSLTCDERVDMVRYLERF